MALIRPPFYFTDCTDNMTGTPSTTSCGTNFTIGGSNADGSSVSVLSALAHDVHFLVIGFAGGAASGTNSRVMIDILIDPAGGTSWTNFIDNLAGWGVASPDGSWPQGLQAYYYFPIFVKSGTSLGVRARRAAAANLTTAYLGMWAFGNPSHPQLWWCGSGVETLGVTNEGATTGTNVAPGASGSWSSWVNVGTSTHPYGAVQYGCNNNNSSASARGGYWALGYGGQQLAGSPYYHQANTNTELFNVNGMAMPIWCNVAAGTTWQVRGMYSGTSANDHDAMVYGVY